MSDARTWIGVDVGGLSLKAVRLSAGARAPRVEARAAHLLDSADRTEEGILARVAALVLALDPSGASSVGVAAAGVVRADEGTVAESPNFPAWRDFRLAPRLAAALGRPVRLENDASAFVYAEATAGAAQGAAQVLGVTLGTGVGGGLVLDGRLYRGARGMAGEVGHMPLVEDGEPCGCGARGCLEQYASTLFLLRRAERAGRPVPQGERAGIGARLARAARVGDAFAIEAFAELGRNLGRGLAGALNLLNPGLLLVGGGLAAAFELFAPSMVAAIEAHAFEPIARDLAIRRASLGAEAGAIGAALLGGLDP